MLFSRKKKEPQEAIVVNLDYDKLAAAIVNAQKKASEEEFEKDNTAYFSKLVLQIAFFMIGLLLLAFVAYGVYMLITNTYPVIQIVFRVVLWLMVIIYAIWNFVMVSSIGKIRDRNYLVSYFSSMVALTALIVAIVK